MSTLGRQQKAAAVQSFLYCKLSPLMVRDLISYDKLQEKDTLMNEEVSKIIAGLVL